MSQITVQMLRGEEAYRLHLQLLLTFFLSPSWPIGELVAEGLFAFVPMWLLSFLESALIIPSDKGAQQADRYHPHKGHWMISLSSQQKCWR